jgi:DNA (cytosine-5)-methyltransferase 1
MDFDYQCVCSGLGAVSVAWGDFARPVGFAEIDPFAAAVLAHRFAHVPNVGDLTTIAPRIESGELPAPSVLVGGTPCQAFSIAGKRGSMDDARGQLTLSFVKVANAIDAARFVRGQRACPVLWENVPGCLSTDDNAFGCLLAALAGEDLPLVAPRGKWSHAGYVFGPQRTIAWRVLDAQYFGVPQRRPRVFVVASAASGIDPLAVLFECEGLRRDSCTRREAADEVAGIAADRVGSEGPRLICASNAEGAKGLPYLTRSNIAKTVNNQTPLLAFDSRQDPVSSFDTFGALGSSLPQSQAIACGFEVRRLTPIECERLHGLPDDWTNVPWRGKPESPDSLRYAALGNSMAVPVMRWIGQRLLRAMKSPPYRLPKFQ